MDTMTSLSESQLFNNVLGLPEVDLVLQRAVDSEAELIKNKLTAYSEEKLGSSEHNFSKTFKKQAKCDQPWNLWANNLLCDDHQPPNCRLVDFQLVRYSPIGHDLVQLFYLCASRKFRESKTLDKLKYYYKNLLKCLKINLNGNIKIPSWEDIIDGFEEQRLAACVTAVIYLPTVLMDGALGAKIMNNTQSYANYVFKDRRHIVLKNMTKDLTYNWRLRETVSELIELSWKMDSLPLPC